MKLFSVNQWILAGSFFVAFNNVVVNEAFGGSNFGTAQPNLNDPYHVNRNDSRPAGNASNFEGAIAGPVVIFTDRGALVGQVLSPPVGKSTYSQPVVVNPAPVTFENKPAPVTINRNTTPR